MYEILVILALILVNGLLAGAEIAIVAVRRSRIEELARAGRSSALAAKKLRDQPERFLATVQVGITVAGAAAAAFGGSSLADDLALAFADLPWIGRWAQPLAFVTVVGTVSYLSVVLGELVPKSIGLRVSERYALLAAPFLLGLSQLARPIVWFLTLSSNAVLKLFGDHTTFTEARVSVEELRSSVIDAARQGTMQPGVSVIATRALDFGRLSVSEVMIHRRFVVALPQDALPELVKKTFLEHGHQRIPVYAGTIDNVVGYLSWRDVLATVWRSEPLGIGSLLRPSLFVPETKPAVDLLEEMRAQRVHLAIVVDEHGGMQGIVTLEDLLEELVGEIHSEHAAPAAATVVREPDGTFLAPGAAQIRDVNRDAGLALEEPDEAATLGGLCIHLEGDHVPAKGAVLVAADGTELEVLDASPRRVRTVRLRPAARKRSDGVAPERARRSR